VLRGCGWLVRLLPELAEMQVVPAPSWTLPPEQERRLMVAAVARLLQNAAGPAGTLLVLDDLQWAGVDALDLLTTLLQMEHMRPLHVLGAYRDTEVAFPDPLAALLANLAPLGLAVQQSVRPLAEEDSARLLAQLWGAQKPPDAERIAQVAARTGGVPFFLISCARAIQVGSIGDDLPWDVAQSLRQRLAALPQA